MSKSSSLPLDMVHFDFCFCFRLILNGLIVVVVVVGLVVLVVVVVVVVVVLGVGGIGGGVSIVTKQVEKIQISHQKTYHTNELILLFYRYYYGHYIYSYHNRPIVNF